MPSGGGGLSRIARVNCRKAREIQSAAHGAGIWPENSTLSRFPTPEPWWEGTHIGKGYGTHVEVSPAIEGEGLASAIAHFERVIEADREEVRLARLRADEVSEAEEVEADAEEVMETAHNDPKWHLGQRVRQPMSVLATLTALWLLCWLGGQDTWSALASAGAAIVMGSALWRLISRCQWRTPEPANTLTANEENEAQREDLQRAYGNDEKVERAEVKLLDSSGKIDWTWKVGGKGEAAPTHIPSKGDVWGGRARAAAVLGQQAMVFIAAIKGCLHFGHEKVNILRDGGATRDFMHPPEAKRRGLPVYEAKHPLLVSLGNGKEILCTHVARAKLVFPNYSYTTEAYLLDMGPQPDCAIILGTPWLTSLGYYVSHEALGTMSFLKPGKQTQQRVTLTSRGKQGVQARREQLNNLQTTTAEARAEIQRAKRHGKECYRAVFNMTNDNEKSSPMVDMANKTAESSCIQTGNLVTTEGTSVQLEIDWRKPAQATIRNVPKQYDMFGTTRELSEVKLHRMSAHQSHLEGRTGEVVQEGGPVGSVGCGSG